MSNGILMFAFNSVAHTSDNSPVEIDYIKMAIANSILIKRHMKNNQVCLVTDSNGKKYLEKKDKLYYFDHVIVQDKQYKGKGPNDNLVVNTRAMRNGTDTIRVPWQNQSRPDAYRLSPFDKTILLELLLKLNCAGVQLHCPAQRIRYLVMPACDRDRISRNIQLVGYGDMGVERDHSVDFSVTKHTDENIEIP